VSDLVWSFTANNINSFAYLNWIQKNWKDVQTNPAKYLPWNFKIDTEKIAVKMECPLNCVNSR